jgi:NAD(P)H-dependent flavin oxidoreductase YrpB (nitropropane dioxygenase family)
MYKSLFFEKEMFMKLPKLRIGNLIARIPIIQGGMGVGISLSGLASAVANEGGIGVISGTAVGFREPDFRLHYRASSIKGLKEEIRKAREDSPDGIIGLNLLSAMTNFAELAKAAVEEGIDIIFAGAGLPMRLPEATKGTDTKAVPIVSSARAAVLICKNWDNKYSVVPDAIVVEGPLAGGHLGYSAKQLDNIDDIDVEDIALDVKKNLMSFEQKYDKHIPVVVAGGIYDGNDIARVLAKGLDGVQMATRFVATYECDADERFKMAYVNAKKEDIIYIQSPVGLVGRAIKNKFLDDVAMGIKRPIRCQYNCLKTCDPKASPYCIADALLNARQGDLDNGFAFAGANVYRIDRIVSVKELINELVESAEVALDEMPKLIESNTV